MEKITIGSFLMTRVRVCLPVLESDPVCILFTGLFVFPSCTGLAKNFLQIFLYGDMEKVE